MVGRKGAPRCRFLSGGNEAADKSIVPEYREESDDSGEDKIRLSSSTQSEINLKQYRKITLSCAVYGNTPLICIFHRSAGSFHFRAHPLHCSCSGAIS